MEKMKLKGNRGLVWAIVVVIGALIVLGYFGFDIEKIIKSPTAQKNLNYIWNFAKGVWNNYVLVLLVWFWNSVGSTIRWIAGWW